MSDVPASVAISIDTAGLQRTIAEVSEALAGLREWVISNPEQYQGTIDLAREMRKGLDAWEADRKSVTAGLNQTLKIINGRYRPGKEAYEACIAILDSAIDTYDRAQKAQYRAGLAAAAQAHAKGYTSATNQALALATSAAAVPRGTTVIRKWVATVINPGLVPYEYLAPDLLKIGAHASRYTENQEPSPIPGVRFDLEGSVRIRRNAP